MPSPFSRTIRSINAESSRLSTIALLAAATILGGWALWFVAARVAIYETSEAARLEVGSGTYPIEAAAAGRVIKTNLTIGREVQAGEALVELESDSQKLQLIEEEARVAAAGLVAELNVIKAKAEADRLQAAADSLKFSVNRQDKDQRAKQSGQQAVVENLNRDAATLEGEIRTRAAIIERLKHEIERRVIRAPASGKLGETATLHPGQFVREGDKLGAVAPDGKLRGSPNSRRQPRWAAFKPASRRVCDWTVSRGLSTARSARRSAAWPASRVQAASALNSPSIPNRRR